MEPAMRKNFCLIKQYGTSHWIPKEKKSFCPNQQIGINPLVLQKNNIFSLAEQVGINHWILHKNKIELYGLTCSILHKNEKKAGWYKSLNPDIKYWILQTKIRLCHKSNLIRKAIETQVNMI